MLAFLGGTGEEGRGLALRLALSGESVIIGSRDKDRAEEAACDLKKIATGSTIWGMDNANAAEEADIAFITVPYEAQNRLLTQISGNLLGKIVVDVVAPMKFERGIGAMAVEVAAGSAAEEAQALLPESLIVSAFQNVSAADLLSPEKEMDGDVLVCSDNENAKRRVMDVVNLIKSLRPVNAGSLANSKYIEQITPLLVNINRLYKVHSGIAITGLE
ncbi:MAG: NADPH-dependent F420 reductase [Chloroflexota bacterium]|nr:NADPH-dependent F420 reductase [Chloroflexota bacterium]